MKKYFVPYEICVALKEIGFEEPTGMAHYEAGEFCNYPDTCYTNTVENISAPLYDQVIEWLSEVHRIKIALLPFTSGKDSYWIWTWDKIQWNDLGKRFPSRDEALTKAIELIKQKEAKNV